MGKSEGCCKIYLFCSGLSCAIGNFTLSHTKTFLGTALWQIKTVLHGVVIRLCRREEDRKTLDVNCAAEITEEKKQCKKKGSHAIMKK